jgi:2-polyprenyl-3-methyl-5-hydroxy-6-metoxy-1,4-benzoquinol methylase
MHTWYDPGRATEHAGPRLVADIGALGGPYDIIACEPCGLTHAVPLPDDAWVADYYRTRFYGQSKPDYVARYERDRAWWQLWHLTVLHRCAEQLCASGRIQHLRVLDVGSGPGLFLDTAKVAGWRTYGLELDAELAARSCERGHRVENQSIDDYVTRTRPPLAFDLIAAWEVLEHVPDPATVCARLATLACPGGLLAVVVPNDFSVLQRRAQEQFALPAYWAAPPEHLTYFSLESVTALLARTGWRVVDALGTFPLEAFMVHEERLYVGNDDIGRACHQDRMALEMQRARAGEWPALMECYRHQLQEHGMGREIVLLAQREETSCP